ncbi:predicted protein [Chaetoceros tenuissimus]|uniref:Uncharacterized protein n=1 Tax=Chaetoceros tenuissimus TaxID=426638 RepID=A0AAD3CQW6_9STRA|nr:predicted protein [Chaetoceros tenuissimus]
MPRTTEWGSASLKASNKKVEKEMFDMYLKLGEDPKGRDGKPMTADEFHGASANWKQYNSTSFRSAFKRVQNLVAKGIQEYPSEEKEVKAPTKTKPFTSSSSAQAPPAEEYEADFEEEESSDSTNELLFGTNEGQVTLPLLWCQVTHPPQGDDNRRTKRVHILMQMLSGTDAKTGYAISNEPKSNELVFALQKDNEEVMWGDAGRVIIEDRFAAESMKMHSAEATNNFTEIPKQEQRLVFPFILDRVLQKKPFYVKVNDGPAGNYLGLYVVAKVDWDDKEAASAGDDFYEVKSPLGNNKTANFYHNKSSVTPSKPAASAFRGQSSAASSENDLSDLDSRMLQALLRKLNIQHEDIMFDDSIAKTSNITPRSVKQKKKSVAAKKPVPGTNLVNHFLNSIPSSLGKKTQATEATSGDEDGLSYEEDDESVQEVYRDD